MRIRLQKRVRTRRGTVADGILRLAYVLVGVLLSDVRVPLYGHKRLLEVCKGGRKGRVLYRLRPCGLLLPSLHKNSIFRER
jgi:hypothetical protein